MRVIVFFDLPTTTSEDLRNYRGFRNKLMKLGFMMLQKSVYMKLAFNPTVEKALVDKVKHIKPPKGLVQILTITEKQFGNIRTIVGEYTSETLDSDDRTVIL